MTAGHKVNREQKDEYHDSLVQLYLGVFLKSNQLNLLTAGDTDLFRCAVVLLAVLPRMICSKVYDNAVVYGGKKIENLFFLS